MKNIQSTVLTAIKKAPRTAGVYQFKGPEGKVLYIGKAKSLRARLQSYVSGYGKDWKATSLLDASDTVETVQTESELAAMLLEARMIQSYQPPFNVLLKTGQPYTYFLITQKQGNKLSRFELVRTKHKKGTYFGPFIEKTAARHAHRFLQEAFQLQLCDKNIPGGCLAYHMHRCAGICRPDFDREGYEQRVALLRRALRSPKERMLTEIDEQVAQSNTDMRFERSAQLVGYKKALKTMYESLATQFDRPTSLQKLADRDLWVWQPAGSTDAFGYLFLFRERNGVLNKARLFCLLGELGGPAILTEYLSSFYRLYRPAPQILVSHELEQPELLAQFAAAWHEVMYDVTVDAPARDAHTEIMLHAKTYAQHELAKRQQVPRQLKSLLALSIAPRRIDCFDISHKQGHAMVGSCVRFTDGRPDGRGVRNFYIKTVEGQNDYASLQEIVLRRYRTPADLPDLIVIDGGKGQLSAVRAVIGGLLQGTSTALVSLAKREETVFSDTFPEGKVLNQKSLAGQTLIALRDYAHHRAVSFHRSTVSRKGGL